MSSLREKYFGNSKVSSNTNISTTSRLRQKYGLDTQKDKEKWYENYFSKGAFEDGYQFGDVTKTVASTVGDLTTNFLKGPTGIGDAFGKLGASVIAQVADWMGKDEYADKVRNRIAGKDEETNEKLAKYTPTGLLTKANEAISKDSVLEEKSDNIVNSVGYLGGQVALQSIGVPWQVTAGVNSAGNELSNAYANNAKDYEAWLSAGLNAGIEIGSEYLFSGVKLPGTGKASEELIGGLTEKIKNKGLKYSLELLTQVGGEGLEEVISGYGNALGQKLTYMSEKELNELYNSDQALEDFVSGALVSVLANGANPNTYNDIKTGKSLITGNTIDEAKVNSVINENLERKEINFKDLDDLQKQIALDKINSKINEYHVRQEQNKLTKEQQQQIAKLEKQLNVLQKEVDNQNNVDIKEKINMPTVNNIVAQEQKTSNVNLPSPKINSSKVNLPTVNDLIKNSINTNSNSNQSLPTRNLTFEESASRYNIDINNDTIKSISKLMSNRGINARFDNNLFNDTNTNAVWVPITNKRGQIIGREVVFNPNADTNQLLQDVAIHEMYHDIASSGNGNVISELIQSFNLNIDGFEKARQELSEMYAKKYPNLDQNSTEFQNIVNEEVVASILGKKLGSQEYINRLVHEKPSVAKRIYDFVIDKLNQLNKLVGYKNEKLFWEDVKNKFEKAYREEYKQTNKKTDAKYSIVGVNGVKNLKNGSLKNLLIDSYNYAVNLSNQNASNEEIYKQTYWYQDDKGNWKIEIPDNKMTINYKQNIKPGVEYKLDDIIEHDLLFSLYPELKNYTINFKNYDSKSIVMRLLGKSKNMKKGGNFNSVTKAISVNKNWLSKKNYDAAIRKTLIHEIQHAIQNIEGFETGASSKISRQHYLSSKGEAEARVTSERLDYSDRSRKRKLEPFFESQKNNLDKKYNSYMNNRGVIDKIKDNLYNYFEKVLSNENFEEVDIQFEDENPRLANDRGIQRYVNEELDNSSFSFKQKQLDIILENNPVHDNYHTWIRTVDDIKTFEETLEDNDYKEYYEAGENFDETYSADMAREAIETGKITVYSSYPIEQGIFVSPSRMEAESYSGNGKVYSKEVNLTDVAWIDATQGQYAKVNDTKYSQNNGKWQEYLNKNYKSEGTGQTLQDIKLPTRKDVSKINMPLVENKVQTESIVEEPQKLANILTERPVTIEEKDNWLKKLLTIKILDKGYYVDKLARQTKNKELSSKYDYMLMANGVAQQIIGNERFNPKTQKSEGKGLHKIFEPIENSGKLQEFTEYMYHKHNVSRMSLNTLYQEDNKPIFGDGVTSETSKNIVENFESKNPEFIEWAEEVYNYNNFLLDVLVDYGVISNENKAYYNKKYPYYVPTIRATDKTKTQMEFIGKKASVNTPIKKAKGGNQDIIPLKEAMALRTMQTLNSALRNNFGIELLNTIETEAESNKINIDDVVGDDIDAEEFLTKSTKKAPATLTVFQNGEKITFDIADEIYEALAPSKRYKFKILNKISQIRRALITEYNAVFMLTNPIKDVQDGALNSKHPSLFLKNIAEASMQIKNKGDFYKLYLANGGSYETYFNYGEGYNKLPTKRGSLDPRKILDKISQINQSIEMTPRLAEFISSLESGESIETAMYNAQEITTNFKRGGDWTKNLDANGVTFLNAGVQGALKQVRNFQEAKSQGIKGITNLAVKWSIAGITPYILSQLIWGDDDDYEELSDYVKNNYYILWKNSDGTFVRIPKGRVMSVIQNLFKQPLDALKGEKVDVKEFIELLQNQVLPSDPTESNIISPLLDVAQNKTWYGGDLVPQRLQSLPEEEQYDESTDSISIWLGQKLGISPIKINYILDQYSGAIGDIILPTLTLEAENDSNSFMSNLLAPMKDKFTTDSVMNNQNISDLYDLDDELTKKSKSSNASTEDILKSKYINSIQTEMNKLTAEKRTIQNDTTLTNNEKYKQVKEIQKQINQLAKDGLNNYNNVEVYDNYAKVGDKEYYKNNSDEWQKLDTTTAKYKTANQITTYDKYLTYQNEIDTIKNKYENTNQRKNAVINYVNSLKLSIPQKAMLIKMNYSSFDSYNWQIIEYINNQDLSKDEKAEILAKLGFTVKDGRVYY